MVRLPVSVWIRAFRSIDVNPNTLDDQIATFQEWSGCVLRVSWLTTFLFLLGQNPITQENWYSCYTWFPVIPTIHGFLLYLVSWYTSMPCFRSGFFAAKVVKVIRRYRNSFWKKSCQNCFQGFIPSQYKKLS